MKKSAARTKETEEIDNKMDVYEPHCNSFGWT